MTDDRATYRSALAHRDFRLLVTSFVVDQIGGWTSFVVLLAYVYQHSHSATFLALTTAARWVPGFLASAYGGVLADRFDRARLMSVSALLCAAVSGGMTVLVAFEGPLAILLLLSATAALVSSPYRPAAGALTADSVGEKDLAAANSLYALLESATVVVGPSLGGLLLAFGSPAWGLGLNAASFVVAAALVSRVRTRSRGSAGQAGESVRTQMTVGFRAVLGEPVARTLMLFVFLDTMIYGTTTVIYIPLSVHLGTGPEGYGYLLAGQALGGVLVAGVANRASGLGRLAPVLVGGMLVLALPFAVTAAVGSPVVAFVLMVVAGAGMVLIDVLAITALQRDLPRDVLSRALGLLDGLVLAACVLGSTAAVALLGATNLRTSLLVIGLGFAGIALLCGRPLVAADRKASGTLAETNARIALLQRLDILAAASRPALEGLARGLETVELPAGAVIIREGEAADALWVLASGRLAVTVSGKQLPDVRAPGFVGELGLLRRGPRTATVTTAEASVLWRIEGSDFLAALDQFGASVSMTGTARVRMARGVASASTPSGGQP